MLKRIAFIIGLLMAASPAAAQTLLCCFTPVTQGAAVPVLTGAGDTVSYVGGGAATVLESAIIVSCTCTQLTSATVSISAGVFSGDTLAAAVSAGLTAVYSSPTLTISGTADVSAYLQALQSVSFSSSNADPTNAGSNPTRTITWTANNGAHASNQPTTTVNVTNPSAIPTLAGAGSTDTFTSGGSPTIIESAITTACSCSNLTGATVTLSSGLLALDTLAATTVGSITSAYDSSAGVLTLSGTDTKANYQTVLRSVTYSSGLADPTNGGADTSRGISWVAFNGPSNSAAVTSTIITQNPAVPTIVVAAGNSISYTSGGVGVAVDNVLSVSCTCANLSGATLTLSSGFFNGDILAVSTAFGITPVYNSVTGVMNLSGTSTVANYQTLLRTILYSSSAGDPSNGGHNATRTATWVASNGANVSFPATTTINVFLTGQPTWAMTGAVVALNPSINQAWVSGTGTGPLSSQISVTRTTTETCYTGVNPVAVTYAAPNDFCATGSGLAIWPSYTNYLPQSNDVSASKWASYCGGNCPLGGSTVTITGNSVLDPTNVTSQASKVALTRTSTGNFAAVINNQANAPAATYSLGVWLKADAGGDVGKVIQFAFLAPSGYTVHNVTLNADWTWVTFANAGFSSGSGCVAATQSCQFQVGLTNQPGSGTTNTTLAANFDVWGGELNLGTVTFPTVPTALAPVVTAADAVVVNSGSALETALTGAASSVIMNSTLGVSSQVATLIDSNGTSWLGEAASNKLTTAIGSTVSTSNTAFWNSPNVEGLARDGSGRTMGLNGSVIVKDTQATSIATPLTLGSTIGTPNNTNYFTGYLGTLNAFNVRIADSLIGVTGAGTSFFFANNATCLAVTAGTNGSCADSNPCTTLQPCNTITKANNIAIVTNDHLHFNGGDTFIGCLTESGGINWNATRAQPATIDSYGTGQATLTGNCTAGAAKIGIINLISADGVVVNNLNFVGDSAGNANRGISLKNCDNNLAHGTITIQNNTFTNIHDGAASGGDFGAAIFPDPSCNNAAHQIDHITVLNNTDAGASPTALDNNFTNSYGYKCGDNYDVIQGNIVFNLGGLAPGGGSEGNGILIAACGVGSGNNAQSPNGLPGAIAQFNVVHDNARNSTGCGGPFGIWTAEADAVTIRMNEVYNFGLNATGGCDKGAYDLDAGGGNFATNSIVERNYSHGNFGPMMLFFGGSNNAARWNISDGDGFGFSGHGLHSMELSGGSLMFAYNNVLSTTTAATGGAVSFNGCPAAGSLFANNIIVERQTGGLQWFWNSSNTNTTNICQPGPVGGLTITHNDWFAAGSGALRWWIDNQGAVGTFTASVSGTTASISAVTGVIKLGMLVTGTGIPTSTYLVSCNPACSGGNTATLSQSANVGSETLNLVASASTFANAENLLNEHDGFNVDPLFVSPFAGTICANTTSGPQGSNCPAGMKLQAGSTMHAPAGANLTSFPWNLPANNGGTVGTPRNGQGTIDYWGTTLPCPTVGGYPIGAQC